MLMKVKNIFAVSVIAIMTVGGALADIASVTYVDDKFSTVETDVTGNVTGDGNVVTTISASGNTVTATKGITAEEIKNKVESIRDSGTATNTAYPSERAVAIALAVKADSSTVSAMQSDIDAASAAAAEAKEAASSAESAATEASEAAAAATAAVANKVTANAAITGGTATKITFDAKGLVTGGGSLTADDIPTVPSTKVSGLSTVATSGSYDDLTDKPSIPAAYTLPAATSAALGGVKSGGDISVSADGVVTVSNAASADKATTATTATNATVANNGIEQFIHRYGCCCDRCITIRWQGFSDQGQCSNSCGQCDRNIVCHDMG